MRVPIRTTIEEDLLKVIKKRAIDEGCNVNDILEELITQYVCLTELQDDKIVKLSVDSDTFLLAVKSELEVAITEICKKYKLYYNYRMKDFISEIANSIATASYMATYEPK